MIADTTISERRWVPPWKVATRARLSCCAPSARWRNEPVKRFSELTLTEKVIELVRWICVPVVAVVSVVVLGQLAAVVIPRPLAQLPGAPVTPPSDLPLFILHRVFAVLMGLAFVIGGAMMAPRSRTTAAVVLAG